MLLMSAETVSPALDSLALPIIGAVVVIAAIVIALRLNPKDKKRPEAAETETEEKVVRVRGSVVATHVFQHMDSRLVPAAGTGTALRDEDYDVTVSIEYNDPWTGKKEHSHEKTTMTDALRNIPRDSFTVSNSYLTDGGGRVDLNGAIHTYSAALELRSESERLRAAGASETEIAAHIKDHRDALHAGFTWLDTAIPVIVIINESEKGDRYVEFEWKN